jgi:hypothetical protein
VIATLDELVIVAPLAFTLGVGVGLAASSRWLIVRRTDRDR